MSRTLPSFLLALSLIALASWGMDPVPIAAASDTDDSTSSTAKPGDAVQFQPRRPAVGDAVTTKSSSTTSMTINAKSKTVSVNQAEEKEKVVQLLAVAGDLATKAKVTYRKFSKTTSTGGSPGTPVDVVGGKTFVVERKGDALLVTDEQGGKPSTEQEDVVAQDMRSFGKPDDVDIAMASKPRSVGDDMSDVADALKMKFQTEIGGNEKPEVQDARVTLAAVHDRGGHKFADLDIALSFKMKKKGMKMTMTLKGTLTIPTDDVDVASGNMAGPITIDGDATGSGNITFTETSSR
jgi:hypothetical protein